MNTKLFIFPTNIIKNCYSVLFFDWSDKQILSSVKLVWSLIKTKIIRIVSIVILFRKRMFWDGKMLEDTLDASWRGVFLKGGRRKMEIRT